MKICGFMLGGTYYNAWMKGDILVECHAKTNYGLALKKAMNTFFNKAVSNCHFHIYQDEEIKKRLSAISAQTT